MKFGEPDGPIIRLLFYDLLSGGRGLGQVWYWLALTLAIAFSMDFTADSATARMSPGSSLETSA